MNRILSTAAVLALGSSLQATGIIAVATAHGVVEGERPRVAKETEKSIWGAVSLLNPRTKRDVPVSS